jgi:simple sugar transport system substrate-binding protein
MVAAMALAACATPTPVATTEAPTTAPVTELPTIAPTAAVTAVPITIGILLVGPYNDAGWSQATYDGAQYAVDHLPGAQLIYADNVNIAAHPETTGAQFAEQLLARGANVIIFNSDDMRNDVTTFATAHPDVPVIFLSGDFAWQQGTEYNAALSKETDVMGRMEYMKMIAGCAAALTTKTGKIGFLGPLINFETRRLAASAYLGAKYCWEKVANQTAPLTFTVTWIGFWFNIPGFTLDPTQVADTFYTTGYDVVISGIDTTEALVEANKYQGQGQNIYAVAYDFKDGCNGAPNACLGVPYFNWGPGILKVVQTVADGTYTRSFNWNAPDWTNINNPDTGAVGFNKGTGMSADVSTKIDAFIASLGSGLNLWTGPINLQDGTQYLASGVAATDEQIWYLPQLLEGMEGASK